MESVTSPGRSFHSLAAATGNSRSPTVTSCIGQTSRASWRMCEGAYEKEYQWHELVEQTGSRGCTVQTTIRQRHQLEFDVLGRTWPVQFGERRGDVRQAWNAGDGHPVSKLEHYWTESRESWPTCGNSKILSWFETSVLNSEKVIFDECLTLFRILNVLLFCWMLLV